MRLPRSLGRAYRALLGPLWGFSPVRHQRRALGSNAGGWPPSRERSPPDRRSVRIGVDLNPDKFEIGRKMGITDFVNPNDIGGQQTVSEAINDMTGGNGADYCFECIGSVSVMAEAFKSSRMGWGKTVVLGVDGSAAPISIPSFDILKGRSVVGSHLGGIKPKDDIPVLAQKCLDKELELDEFITHRVGFDDINRAFDLLAQGKCLRCIIWMDDGAKVNGA